jgi:putative ABC transport system permease protein
VLFSKLLNIFSIVSVLVATLGLFGIASLSVVKRTKEIAVRKILGASVTDILFMLTSHYVKLIFIAWAFAIPLAYYLISQWLEGFVYRIEVSWWMILLPAVAVLITTLLTVGGQSIKAATTNPADSLKDQ